MRCCSTSATIRRAPTRCWPSGASTAGPSRHGSCSPATCSSPGCLLLQRSPTTSLGRCFGAHSAASAAVASTASPACCALAAARLQIAPHNVGRLMCGYFARHRRPVDDGERGRAASTLSDSVVRHAGDDDRLLRPLDRRRRLAAADARSTPWSRCRRRPCCSPQLGCQLRHRHPCAVMSPTASPAPANRCSRGPPPARASNGRRKKR